MSKSTVPAVSGKPQKPYRDFALFPHQNGAWAKKIKGKCWYFGRWRDDPTGAAALKKYLEQKDLIQSGQDPRTVKAGIYTVGELSNDFLNTKQKDMALNVISARHFNDLYRLCKRMVAFFGAGRAVESIAPGDFEKLSASYPDAWGLKRRKREIVSTRSVFNYAMRMERISRVRFGDFAMPKADKLTGERQRKEDKYGTRLFTPEQLRRILDAAPVPLRAMVLLGVNCGYGNSDVARLRLSHVDLERGWATFARPKTSIKRKAALWPETVTALKEAIAQRPAPADPADAGLVFLTDGGLALVRVVVDKDDAGNPVVSVDDRISKWFPALLTRLGIKRRGLSFYSLRHCTETNAGCDQIATDYVMGHKSPGEGSTYRGAIADDRLRSVSENLHTWLYGPEPDHRPMIAGRIA